MKKFIAVVMASLIGFGSMAVSTEASAGFYRSKSKPFSSRSYSPKKSTISKPSAATRSNWDRARARPTAKTYNTPKSVAPQSTRVPARNTTVIQKNYYNTVNHRGYNSPMYGGGGYGGMGGGSGLGTSILGGAAGAVGGMMLYDALTTDEGEKALKMQEQQQVVQEAKEEQARDDKLEQIEQNQEKILEGQEKAQEVIPPRQPTFYDLDLKNAQ